MTKCKNDLANGPANISLKYSSFPGGARVESGYEHRSALEAPIIVYVGRGQGQRERSWGEVEEGKG